MLGVVNVHRRGVNVRFKGIILIRQIGKCERHVEYLLYNMSLNVRMLRTRRATLSWRCSGMIRAARCLKSGGRGLCVQDMCEKSKGRLVIPSAPGCS